MKNRAELLKSYTDDEDRFLAARALDKAAAAEKSWEAVVGDFCDPGQAQVIRDLIRRRGGDVEVRFHGGYADAERCRPVFARRDIDLSSADYRLVLLRAEGAFRETKVTHRDFLGAILSLGLKREKLGDIIPDETGAYIVIDRDMVPYLHSNLAQVQRVGVTIRELSFDLLACYARPASETTVVVASLRLDAVAAAAFGRSRTDMVSEIEGRRIKLNWRECVDVSAEVRAGDTLSMKGTGRAVIKEVAGETKKGRVRLIIARPIQ